MDATRIMYDAADRLYEEIGEVHGYSGVYAGLAAVAQKLNFDVDRWYFSKHFHDPLSGSEIYQPFVEKRLTFADLASLFDRYFFGQFSRGRSYKPSSPFDAILDGRWQVGYHQNEIHSDWIVNEVKATLKQRKIRRGTSKWKAFHEEHAQKVFDACVDATKNSAAKQSGRLEKQIAESEEALASVSGFQQFTDQLNSIRVSFLDEAGLPHDEKTEQQIEERYAVWQQLQTRLEGHIRYLKDEVSKLSLHDALVAKTIAHMSRQDDLRPFLDASGIAYE